MKELSEKEKSINEAEELSDSTPTIDTDNVEEIGGRNGPEPTRFGDWEKKGRCIDF
ncbi:DUF1674 domain-containing protein [Methylicorpusculum oleiharenae]|uniref:DUF1674 domain-containing protein n=1 Tax=Methylicorpusculum oleiharenae TaxID=1338687 RepID=UPI00135B2891|nr:DUF1674 domain-containing protein [Methylicorpusculum oleiharenae]MCD2453286.1 DUF1674 domain-containing protein [Methylicorpusculum oleiharenae]